jgi:hypothetical protein
VSGITIIANVTLDPHQAPPRMPRVANPARVYRRMAYTPAAIAQPRISSSTDARYALPVVREHLPASPASSGSPGTAAPTRSPSRHTRIRSAFRSRLRPRPAGYPSGRGFGRTRSLLRRCRRRRLDGASNQFGHLIPSCSAAYSTAVRIAGFS